MQRAEGTFSLGIKPHPIVSAVWTAGFYTQVPFGHRQRSESAFPSAFSKNCPLPFLINSK